ncbi:MAG: PIG-L family deacetylase [Pedobacter sp.]|nr:PIG-L family deacetylase [Pedobacter sp.]
MKILVLVAHPDDEAILCGATINKLVRKGHDVHVTFFTRNDEAYFGHESQQDRQKRAVLESRKSSKMLGFSMTNLKFLDMHLVDNKALLMKAIIKVIRLVQPTVIITEHSEDKHIDHRTLGDLVPEANFQSGHNLCGGTLKWSAPLILHGEINLEMTMPFAFEAISNVSAIDIIQKEAAFHCYATVDKEHSIDAAWLNKKLKYVAQIRGQSAGYMFGEAFTISSYTPIAPSALRACAEVLEI